MKNFYGQCTATGGGSIDPIDKIIYEKYFIGKDNGFFIEAGANDGLFLSSCKFFEDMGWSGMNIEPSRKMFERLVNNRPNSINLQVALSDTKGELLFEDIDFDNGGFSRLEHSEKHIDIDRMFGLRVSQKYNVDVDTYINVLNKYDIHNVDLMVLDVEGFEIEVINGMFGFHDRKPNIFCIEHTHVGFDTLKNALENDYKYDWHDELNVIFKKRGLNE